MAIAEKAAAPSLSEIVTTGKIAASSFILPQEDEAKRQLFRSFVGRELTYPVNIEEATLRDVAEVVEERRLAELPIDYSVPYWLTDQRYSSWEAFGAIVQYFDFHREALPSTVLPPEKDVEAFIERVRNSDHPLTISEQFEHLLDISGNNVVGAANIGFIGSRIMGRALDQRAYPHIDTSPQALTEWNRGVAKFEVYDGSGEMDGVGDTYYYWSHNFGALVFSAIGDKTSGGFQRLLDKGTPLMRGVRKHIARRPTQTSHEEASVLGRNIGLATAEMVGVNELPVFPSGAQSRLTLETRGNNE